MSKATQVVVIKSLSDPDKLAAYSELTRPAVEATGDKIIARNTPIAVKEEGEELRTVIEWEGMEAADARYKSEVYQKALAKLDGGAKRAIMYLNAN